MLIDAQLHLAPHTGIWFVFLWRPRYTCYVARPIHPLPNMTLATKARWSQNYNKPWRFFSYQNTVFNLLLRPFLPIRSTVYRVVIVAHFLWAAMRAFPQGAPSGSTAGSSPYFCWPTSNSRPAGSRRRLLGYLYLTFPEVQFIVFGMDRSRKSPEPQSIKKLILMLLAAKILETYVGQTESTLTTDIAKSIALCRLAFDDTDETGLSYAPYQLDKLITSFDCEFYKLA
jgi:hypothetical protein